MKRFKEWSMVVTEKQLQRVQPVEQVTRSYEPFTEIICVYRA